MEGATWAPIIEARMLQAAYVFETERKVKKIPNKYNDQWSSTKIQIRNISRGFYLNDWDLIIEVIIFYFAIVIW